MKEIKIIKKENSAYPKKLFNIENPPKQLYVLGDETLLNKMSIAIIGSRDCTEYGYKQALKFSKEIAQKNVCIVSGMAIGIDSAAHNGAKSEIGKTIAVLGGGFNHIFPKENEDLFYEILEEGGCIVSEYAPNVKAESKYFPVRNRIVSGLSNGVLVVEARHRSGTSITVKYAKQQGKSIFCIPSNLGETTGVGTGRLIQDGASLVLTPDDILIELGLDITKEMVIEEVEKVNVKEEYKKVYELLGKMPMNINEIAKKSKKNVMEINTTLTMLELEGLVKQVGMNEFIKI